MVFTHQTFEAKGRMIMWGQRQSKITYQTCKAKANFNFYQTCEAKSQALLATKLARPKAEFLYPSNFWGKGRWLCEAKCRAKSPVKLAWPIA